MGSQEVLGAQGLAIEEVTGQVVESTLKLRRDLYRSCIRSPGNLGGHWHYPLGAGSWSRVEIRKYSMGHYIYPPVGHGLMIVPRVGYCGEADFPHYSPDNSRHGRQ